ncbi:AI-2E family transporter [Pedobacter xixiisoli]|uniref:Predicted PurR-regulated permease PerM n=1 Tax=Pedobacter xixiisoli TaxID=1476464 RepID=A0A285ZYY5_9SPHI|nr:AI-2E family transporter [Pedobacter xixiisoli]SOD14862.1 Predicted PurR-regulated permease PerM [Pedobacter xixiisoli]
MQIQLPFIVRLTFTLLSILLLGYLAIIGKSILSPLLFSLLLAFLMLPLANFLETKLRLKRSIATIFTVIIMLGLLYGIGHFFAIQLSELWGDWPLLEKQVTNSFHELQHWISKTFHVNISKQETYLADSAEKALATSATVVGTTLITLSSSLLFIAFTLLFTFLMLNYRRLLYKFLSTVFIEEHRVKVTETVNEIQYIIKKYITGLFIQMVIVSVLMILTLSILGVKYAILLGLVAGIFNIIPYLGISISLIISVLITFATAGATKALFVLFAYVGIHTIDGNILMPLIVGSKVKINALIAFIGIVVGEMIWGISGMFLCMPYLAMMKIIFQKVDGLDAWAILLGEEQKIYRKKKRTSLFKSKKTIQTDERAE